jgi:hypothetical protein
VSLTKKSAVDVMVLLADVNKAVTVDPRVIAIDEVAPLVVKSKLTFAALPVVIIDRPVPLFPESPKNVVSLDK